MTQIHSQDEPFRPDSKKAVQNEDSDATFALSADDPARVENRGGLEAVIDGDTNNTDSMTQSEYSSDPTFREDDNTSADQIDNGDLDIDASATHDEDVAGSVGADNAASVMDELEAEMDDKIEDEDTKRDDYPQRSEGSEG